VYLLTSALLQRFTFSKAFGNAAVIAREFPQVSSLHRGR
jgi:hypothetical protein